MSNRSDIGIGIWIFVASGAVAPAIALFIVSSQAIKPAENPMEAEAVQKVLIDEIRYQRIAHSPPF